MEAFLVSTLVVAVGEIGDKTQLLALVLAARFRRAGPIILGILAATVLNHGLAGLVGAWVRAAAGPEVLRWSLGPLFLGIAAWALRPDHLENTAVPAVGRWGIFAVTFVAFFIAEIGDKTQLATVALAARFDSLLAVVAGTTAGMLFADVPAVLLGEKVSAGGHLQTIRIVAAALFAGMGIAVLAGIGLD